MLNNSSNFVKRIFTVILLLLTTCLINSCEKIDVNYIGGESHHNSKPNNWDLLEKITDESPPYFATATNIKPIDIYEGLGTDVTIELGEDQCIYYKYPNGDLVLPILTNGFATPEQISRFFQSKVNKTLKNVIVFDINQNHTYPEDTSDRWMSPPPTKNCKYTDKVKIDYFTIIDIVKNNEFSEYKDKKLVIYPDETLEYLPSYDGEKRFVSIFNQEKVRSKDNTSVTGKLKIDENQCLYLYDEKGKEFSLIFTGNRVYWDDTKNSINIDGHYINLNKIYKFDLSGDINLEENKSYPVFNRELLVKKPHSICNNSSMNYVKDIKNISK